MILMIVLRWSTRGSGDDVRLIGDTMRKYNQHERRVNIISKC